MDLGQLHSVVSEPPDEIDGAVAGTATVVKGPVRDAAVCLTERCAGASEAFKPGLDFGAEGIEDRLQSGSFFERTNGQAAGAGTHKL